MSRAATFGCILMLAQKLLKFSQPAGFLCGGYYL